ncbi:YtxH domain-containing protein [Campylobacter fetus]|uniref:YtxH domain-containing protein n=1 Tax=Campylobacter fetus TaxID=196 RepID=UPI00126DD960|nr:YtxH domain-containing protein [Campylobacter fetus]MPB73273.1 YtxH domain-containing protein [Campylobacter fetus]MPB77487.1 YtxH domain-containing protein [Campylobacter fetus]
MTNPYINNQNTNKSAIDETINKLTKDIAFIPDNFNTAGFLKGVLLGAGITYLLTNQNAQQALFKAIIKATDLLQSGTEELKERFEDAKAEVNAQK